MKLLYFGPFWDGSTSVQRAASFRAIPGLEVALRDTAARMQVRAGLYARIRWRLGWPLDKFDENRSLIEAVEAERPDAVIVDNSKIIHCSTLRRLREFGVSTLAYYTPDDAMNTRNLKWPLKLSFPEWDVFFTTKTFNVPELTAAGVRRPYLIGKAFDPELHRPMTRLEVGGEFDKFDFVFAGACEPERLRSLNRLCEAGFSVVVYGGDLGKWDPRQLHPRLESRPAIFSEGYTMAMHHGKLALCFLRKANRDQITQRTMEITAMGRPMLAEKTAEHDEHFIDGVEYAGFRDDDELIALARKYLADHEAALDLGRRARARCLAGGYSTLDRAAEMAGVMGLIENEAPVRAG